MDSVFCKNCGIQVALNDTQKFCPNCGSLLCQTTAEPSAVNQNPEQPMQAPPPAAKMSKKAKVIAMIAAAVVVALLLVFVVAPMVIYSIAHNKLESGEYKEAKDLFELLGNYRDSEEISRSFVYAVTEYSCEFASGESDFISKFKYDNMGMLVYADGIGPNRDIFEMEYDYDKHGNWTAYRTRGTDGLDISTTCEYTYRNDGKVKTFDSAYSDGRRFVGKISYDSNGQWSKKELCLYSANGDKNEWTQMPDQKPTEKDGYTYDSHGNVISFRDPNNPDIWEKYNHTYNGGLLVESRVTQSDSQWNRTGTYAYDKSGKLTRYETFYDDPEVIKSLDATYLEEYTYYKHGGLKEICVSYGEDQKKEYYRFDDNGCLVEVSFADGTVRKWAYVLAYRPEMMNDAPHTDIEYYTGEINSRYNLDKMAYYRLMKLSSGD